MSFRKTVRSPNGKIPHPPPPPAKNPPAVPQIHLSGTSLPHPVTHSLRSSPRAFPCSELPSIPVSLGRLVSSAQKLGLLPREALRCHARSGESFSSPSPPRARRAWQGESHWSSVDLSDRRNGLRPKEEVRKQESMLSMMFNAESWSQAWPQVPH